MTASVKPKAPTILLVDDEEMIRALLHRSLVEKGYIIVTSGSRQEALDKVSQQEFDLVVVDKNLPDGSGFEVIDAVHRRGHKSEVIVITAYSDTESAIHAVSLGVFRYVRKPFDIKALVVDIGTAIETGRLRRDLARRTAELEEANRALRTNESRYRLLFNSGNDAVFVYPLTSDGLPDKFVEVNDIASSWLGYSREELQGMSVTDLYDEISLSALAERTSHLLLHHHALHEVTLRARNGKHYLAEINARLFELQDRQAVLAIARDITARRRNELERLRLEDQFRESQKMEAIGRLAGGIAHDMNNLLGAIMGLSSSLESILTPEDAMRKDIREILAACRKGRDLTRDLLGFARKGKYRKQRFILNQVVLETQNILSRTIPRTVVLNVQLSEDLWAVEGDTGQIGHAIMNVCINALDAMRGRGALVISTKNETVTEEAAQKTQDLAPGKYVLLEVNDTGAGMDAKTLEAAFEPFFTTKPQGKGTGLGLAMVYGTVRNHGGAVTLHSQIGKGTHVRIYLPARDAEQADPKPISRPPVQNARTGATIMLVDDEPMIRSAGQRLLDRLGYKAIIVGSGEEAIKIYSEKKEDIWLVILDIIMPSMDGEEVFHALRAMDPQARVLLSSGYSKEDKAEELLGQGAVGFIQKPFDLKALASTLSELG